MKDTLFEYQLIKELEDHSETLIEKPCLFGEELQILEAKSFGFICTRHTRDHRVQIGYIVPQNKGHALFGEHSLIWLSEIDETRYKIEMVKAGLPLKEVPKSLLFHEPTDLVGVKLVFRC